MKNIFSLILIILISLTQYNCHSEEKQGEQIKIDSCNNSIVLKKDSVSKEAAFAGKPISFYLNHPGIPRAAKDLYLGKIEPNENEEAFNLPDSIFSNVKDTKAFYFLALTKSMIKSDGAYSEGLSVMTKKFVETRTPEFLTYFIEEPLLTETDYKNWIFFVSSEIEMSAEKKELEEVQKMELKMKSNCENCSTQQKNKMNEFIKKVKEYILKYS